MTRAAESIEYVATLAGEAGGRDNLSALCFLLGVDDDDARELFMESCKVACDRVNLMSAIPGSSDRQRLLLSGARYGCRTRRCCRAFPEGRSMTVSTLCALCVSNPAQAAACPVPFEGDELCIECDREVYGLPCTRCGDEGWIEISPSGDPEDARPAPCPDCHPTERSSE